MGVRDVSGQVLDSSRGIGMTEEKGMAMGFPVRGPCAIIDP